LISGSFIYEDKTCSICLADRANIKLECSHYFHRGCLWTWYKNKNSCPNCRCRTKLLKVFCDVCDYEYYTISILDAMRERTADSFGQ
jgi:hypothetical protein